MKKNFMWMMAAILTSGFAVTSCTTNDNPVKQIKDLEVLSIDFESGEAADYWQWGNGYLVTPELAGSTGQCASVKSNKDRADYFFTPVDFTGVVSYTIDFDIAICGYTGQKNHASFAVMCENSLEVGCNWGWFYPTPVAPEVKNPSLFNLTFPGSYKDDEGNVILRKAFVNLTAGLSGQEPALDENEGTWEYIGDNWYHVKLTVDVAARTVNYNVKDKTFNTVSLKGTFELPEGDSPYLTGFYERNNRNNYDPGAILIDNVKVKVSGIQ